MAAAGDVMAAAGDGSYTCSLTAEEIKKAREELNEDPKQRQSHIQALREWLLEQPHIKGRSDDTFLLRFLRVAKFSQTRARAQLDHYITTRCSDGTSGFFNQTGEVNATDRKLMELGFCMLLPELDDEGRGVCLLRNGCFDANEFTVEQLYRVFGMMAEIGSMREQLQVNGVVALSDFTGFSLAHAARFTPGVIRRLSKTWQECIPFRPKSLNYYNTPTVFNALFEILKLFLKEKMKKRLKVHKSNLDSVHKEIPARILPHEFGGSAGKISDLIDYNKKLLLDNLEELKKNASFSLDESKRPAPGAAGQDNELGVAGSFRKLTVD